MARPNALGIIEDDKKGSIALPFFHVEALEPSGTGVGLKVLATLSIRMLSRSKA